MKHLFLFMALIFFGLAAPAQKVKISTKLGDIVVLLEPEKAPVTVENFINYIVGNFYKGGSFFRTVTLENQPDALVKIQVVQAGIHPWKQNFLFDPIPLERTTETGLSHKNGTISMARGAPDSAQYSFFICIDDQPELDYGGNRNPDGQGFAAFGQVIEGMEIVRKIQTSPAEGQALMPPIVIDDMVIME